MKRPVGWFPVFLVLMLVAAEASAARGRRRRGRGAKAKAKATQVQKDTVQKALEAEKGPTEEVEEVKEEAVAERVVAPPSPPETSATDETAVEEEEAVDFAEEETESDRRAQRIVEAAGGHPHAHGGPGGGGGLGKGLKLFVDLLADHHMGEKFEFRPNHFYVLLQAQVNDSMSFSMHVSDAPVFYELTWNVTPRLALKLGKLFIPFGANEFHHLFGGRVDERSHFLPETWGDYGIGLTHQAFDGDVVAVDYALYLVNGFQGAGAEGPVFVAGGGTDNNYFKGMGARVRLELLGSIVGTGSIYYDRWDSDNEEGLVFYAAGLELRPGLFDVPVLRRLRLRGEWGRGEIELPGTTPQQGLIPFTKGRGAFYGEALYSVLDNLDARFRVGRINPDNRVTDEGDVDILEPAVLISVDKVVFTLAYQMVKQVGRKYSSRRPSDVAYAKFFLQF